MKQCILVTLTFTQVETLVGNLGDGPSEGHPRIREQLARQGIDLTLPVLAWPDKNRQVHYYRNRKAGDPEMEEP